MGLLKLLLHSSEKKCWCLMKWPNKMLQILSKFWNMKKSNSFCLQFQYWHGKRVKLHEMKNNDTILIYWAFLYTYSKNMKIFEVILLVYFIKHKQLIFLCLTALLCILVFFVHASRVIKVAHKVTRLYAIQNISPNQSAYSENHAKIISLIMTTHDVPRDILF